MAKNLSGKVFIVTGASSGIGLDTAKSLVTDGAIVIMATRSEAKTRPIVDEINGKTTNGGKAIFLQLELDSLKKVGEFCEEFEKLNLPLHGLINNAGFMAPTFELSKDGIESTFAVNHLGHFHLTNRLLPHLEKSQPSRIVNVSSAVHTW